MNQTLQAHFSNFDLSSALHAGVQYSAWMDGCTNFQHHQGQNIWIKLILGYFYETVRHAFSKLQYILQSLIFLWEGMLFHVAFSYQMLVQYIFERSYLVMTYPLRLVLYEKCAPLCSTFARNYMKMLKTSALKRSL